MGITAHCIAGDATGLITAAFILVRQPRCARTQGSGLPSGVLRAPNTIAVGNPLRVYALGDERLTEAIRAANFA